VLDDELTLLDGTEVISWDRVIKLTTERFPGRLPPLISLYTVLREGHETTLAGREYYNRDLVFARLIAGA
jgi:hypothetical protein